MKEIHIVIIGLILYSIVSILSLIINIQKIESYSNKLFMERLNKELSEIFNDPEKYRSTQFKEGYESSIRKLRDRFNINR